MAGAADTSSSFDGPPSTNDSRLSLLTSADVHHGVAKRRDAARATVVATAYAAHQNDSLSAPPHPPPPPEEVWINPQKAPRTLAGITEYQAILLAHEGTFA